MSFYFRLCHAQKHAAGSEVAVSARHWCFNGGRETPNTWQTERQTGREPPGQRSVARSLPAPHCQLTYCQSAGSARNLRVVPLTSSER